MLTDPLCVPEGISKESEGMENDAESDLIICRSRSEGLVRLRVRVSPVVWISPPNCTSEFLKLQSWGVRMCVYMGNDKLEREIYMRFWEWVYGLKVETEKG